MDTCIVCGRDLWRGMCVSGHPQSTEPDTIDEALTLRSRILGDVMAKAKAEGLLPPIDPSSWSK